MSQGPFRPYTVLSARALATFLASEDQPEKGLCPNRLIVLERFEPSPTVLDRGKGQHRKQLSHRPEKSLQSSDMISRSLNSNHPIAMAPRNYKDASVQVDNDHCESEESTAERTYNPLTKSILGNLQEGTEAYKKDAKSFAQSFFDTAAMKNLYLRDTPMDYLRWFRGSKPNPREFSPQIDHQKNPENGTGVHWDDVEIENPGKELVELPEAVEGNLGAISPQNHAPNGSDTHHSTDNDFPITPAGGVSSDTLESNQSDSIDKKASPETLSQSQKKTIIANELPSLPLQSSSKFGENALAQNRIAYSKSQDTAFMLVPSDPVKHFKEKTPQCLSRLSMENIKGLAMMVIRDNRRLLDEHISLRRQGRGDMPTHLSIDSHSNFEDYESFLRFTDQSISYVLADARTLLKSFVHYYRDSNSCTTVWSYDLLLMTSCLRLLRHLDFQPFSILPSLSMSTRCIHPLNSGRKRTSAMKTSMPPLSGLSDALDDVEASHIVKIIVAALIATVPEYDAETLFAVSKLRAAGNIAPCLTGDSPPRYRYMVERVLNVASNFEDEMALSLVKSMVEAIVARQYRVKSSQDYKESYWSLEDSFHGTISYLIADDFKMVHSTSQASPSLKGSTWYEHFQPKVTPGLKQPLLVLIEWLRTLILKEWDGKVRVKRCSAIGGALSLLSQICECITECFLLSF